MLACLDVDYRAQETVTACLTFAEWTSAVPLNEVIGRAPGPAEAYEPGSFYRRELPHLIATLARVAPAPLIVVIDGFVWLDAGRPGLGAHLHRALGGRGAVVGVAKRPFRGADRDVPVLRGASKTPLHVTAIGLDVALAAAGVESMHGAHRLPTLLKRVDRLCRDR